MLPMYCMVKLLIKMFQLILGAVKGFLAGGC